MEASSNLIFITDGAETNSVNKTLLEFLDCDTISQFFETHESLSDLFVPYKSDALLSDMAGQSWLEYVIEHPDTKLVYMYKAGTLYIFKPSVSQIHIDSRNMYAIILVDITSLKESEFKNILYAKRAEALLNLPRLNHTLSESEFMQRSLDFCEDLTQSKVSFIHFVNDDEQSIEFITWSNRTLRDYCHAVSETHYPASQAGIWAQALYTKKAFICNDYKNTLEKKGLPEGHAHLERFISLPVIESAKVVMLCGVGNKSSDYSSIELESLQLIANETWNLIQRKRNLAQLEDARELLVVQSRQAVMGETMSMLAHQWRQPLSIIEMCINNVFLDIDLDTFNIAELRSQLKDVVSQTHYLSETIDDFRNFFQPENARSNADITQIISNALRLVGKSLEGHGIKITVDMPELLLINTYAKELLQVCINILTNAKDALLGRNIDNPSVAVHVSSNEQEISIKFTDNAKGIDTDKLEKIFEPYFSTKTQKDGTGLGLYMCKIIVEKHLEGKIIVSNTENGACFELVLPKN